MNNKLVIGIWQDEGGIYFRCNNCNYQSKHHASIATIPRLIQEHRKVCERLTKWTDMDIHGKKTNLIGFEVIWL